jgi:Protein of unknown function (DUF732)
MRKSLVRAAILGAGAMAICAAVAANEIAAAHADEDGLLSDMEAAGFNNGNGAEIYVGYDICRELANGWSPAMAAADLWKSSKLEQWDSKQFVNVAIRDLCPRYASA